MSTGRVHGIITGFRCVDQNDKAFAIGLESTFISLVAWIPAPIVYGAIIGEVFCFRIECIVTIAFCNLPSLRPLPIKFN